MFGRTAEGVEIVGKGINETVIFEPGSTAVAIDVLRLRYA